MKCRYILMLVAVLSATVGALAQERPNIVVILADDMGYSDIGCYGGEIHTPNLDRLAGNGVRFRSFYNAGRCCPTRASLLTGQYPHAAGMGAMITYPGQPVKEGPYQGFLYPGKPTIAEVLRTAGYRTYMSGKWHVGERPEHWPLKRGFDRYFGLISGASSYYEIVEEKRRRVMVADNQRWEPATEDFYMTDAFTERAIGFVEDHYRNSETAERPFLLYLAYTAPHWPLHAPEEVIARYEQQYLQGWDVLRQKRFARMSKLGVVDDRYVMSDRPPEVPPWVTVTDRQQWARRMAVYAAMIEVMDQGIGRLVQQLEQQGQLEHTLIVFLSDNGACAESVARRQLHDSTKAIGQRGSYVAYETPWAMASNTPFKKYKQFMHEGGINTPSIWHWPDGLHLKGHFTGGEGHIIDIMPTLLAVSGATINGASRLYGINLLPLLRGGPPAEREWYWEHFGSQAIRRGAWKLVKDKGDAAWALYDLGNDPAEARDLSELYPEKVQELKERFTQHFERDLELPR